MIRSDAHLLDVGAPIDDVNEHVADRLFGVVDNDPGPAVLRVAGKFLDGGGLIVSDLGHADVAKPLARQTLDLA